MRPAVAIVFAAVLGLSFLPACNDGGTGAPGSCM
jgi:hypothetical protein